MLMVFPMEISHDLELSHPLAWILPVLRAGIFFFQCGIEYAMGKTMFMESI